MENQLKLLIAFGKKYDEEYGKLPYRINLIDELNANENAHTRILVRLLQYDQNRDRNFTILKSLLQRFLPTVYFEIKEPFIKSNERFIDALVKDKGGKYAIIIENKIHGAVDQDKQIERYIQTVIADREIPQERIYVIYLTNNGDKVVSNDSLTGVAKKYLNYTDKESPGHFIQMSYRYDILPWLEAEILPNCTLKESWLISAITQYIDHLKGIFNLRKEMQPMNNELEKMLKEQLRITGHANEDLDKINTHQKLIKKYQETLEKMKSTLVETNPWSQRNPDLSIWFANKIKAYFEVKNQANKLFEGVGLWQNTIVYFNRLNFKNHAFAIDINCKDMGTYGLSLFARDAKDNVAQNEICVESFGLVLQSEEFEFTHGRWRKTFLDITTWNKTSPKETEWNLNKFYDFIDDLLKKLNEIVHPENKDVSTL